jgi:hypothetical protein
MEVDHVRKTLQRMIEGPVGSVTRLAQEIRIPHMTLRRFLSGDVVTPRADAWERMVAYVASLQPPTPEEARGMLRAINRIRQELDSMEEAARSAVRVYPTPEAAADAVVTPPKRRKRGA